MLSLQGSGTTRDLARSSGRIDAPMASVLSVSSTTCLSYYLPAEWTTHMRLFGRFSTYVSHRTRVIVERDQARYMLTKLIDHCLNANQNAKPMYAAQQEREPQFPSAALLVSNIHDRLPIITQAIYQRELPTRVFHNHKTSRYSSSPRQRIPRTTFQRTV